MRISALCPFEGSPKITAKSSRFRNRIARILLKTSNSSHRDLQAFLNQPKTVHLGQKSDILRFYPLRTPITKLSFDQQSTKMADQSISLITCTDMRFPTRHHIPRPGTRVRYPALNLTTTPQTQSPLQYSHPYFDRTHPCFLIQP